MRPIWSIVFMMSLTATAGGGADGATIRDGASGLGHPRDAGHRSHGGHVAYATDLLFLPPPVAADRRGARRAISRHPPGRDAATQERGGRDDDDRIAGAAGAGLPANRSRHRARDTALHGGTGADAWQRRLQRPPRSRWRRTSSMTAAGTRSMCGHRSRTARSRRRRSPCVRSPRTCRPSGRRSWPSASREPAPGSRPCRLVTPRSSPIACTDWPGLTPTSPR